jgi:hypothetical protein
MRGRRDYSFEIATRGSDGEWSVAVARTGIFSRSPKATVRSIAERWIFEQAGQLRGGRLIILGRRRTPPRAFDASVRIRILDQLGGRQLAAAYIGVDRIAPSAGGRDHYLAPALAMAGGVRD